MPTFSGARLLCNTATEFSNSTWTKVVHDTLDFGVSGMHDTTNDRFKATVEGTYKVCFGMGIDEDCNNDDVFYQLRKNSTTASTSSGSTVIYSARHAPAAGSDPFYRGNASVFMEVDDYLEVYVYVNRGASSTARTGTYCSLAAYLDVETTYSGVGVQRTGNVLVTSGVGYIVSWQTDTDNWDTDSYWSSTVNPTRLTATSGGVFRVDVTSGWPQGMGDSPTLTYIMHNGSGYSVVQEMPEANHWYWQSYGDIVELADNDYVEMQVNQNEGASRNLWGQSGWSGTRMTMQRIGD